MKTEIAAISPFLQLFFQLKRKTTANAVVRMSSQVEPEHRARGHFDDDDGEDGLARVPAAAEAHAEEERAPAGERRSLARLLAEDEEEEGPYFLGTSGVDAVRAGDKDDDAVSDRVAADDDDGLVYDGTKLGGDGGAGRKLSNARLCGLSLYWFARSAWWAAFPIILLPLQVALALLPLTCDPTLALARADRTAAVRGARVRQSGCVRCLKELTDLPFPFCRCSP